MDEEGRARARRPRSAGREDPVLRGRALQHHEGARRGGLSLHAPDVHGVSRLLGVQSGLQGRVPDHRRESTDERAGVVGGDAAARLCQRQGCAAAGRALSAGELRAGQEVPDARVLLRKALAKLAHLLQPEPGK